MLLSIFLEKDVLRLSLKLKTARTIDSLVLPYYHNLDDRLIAGVGCLLKRNDLESGDGRLTKFELSGSIGSESTSYKIALAFVSAIKVKL